MYIRQSLLLVLFCPFSIYYLALLLQLLFLLKEISCQHEINIILNVLNLNNFSYESITTFRSSYRFRSSDGSDCLHSRHFFLENRHEK